MTGSKLRNVNKYPKRSRVILALFNILFNNFEQRSIYILRLLVVKDVLGRGKNKRNF